MTKSREASAILDWYDRNRRRLPWRGSTDPYSVWVSEIMLQQTQIERAIPYFDDFLKRFPNVGRLAAASEDEVLAAWSGLGYYRRARALHAAARQIVARGGFPCNLGDWMALPGVGPYTAAAIMSIAFGAVVPVLDGNVERVLSRLVGLEEDPKKASGRKTLLKAAEDLLDADRPGDSNQALMELGATVCRPRNPKCSLCPLLGSCVAFLEGRQESLPIRSDAKVKVEERRIAVVVEQGGRTLLVRRSETSAVLAGLWEIPWVPWSKRPTVERELEFRLGGRWHLEQSCGWVRHTITFRDLHLEVFKARLSSTGEVGERTGSGWFSRAEIDGLATSTLVDKILDRARKSAG